MRKNNLLENSSNYLGMIDISQIIESPSFTDPISMFLAYFKMAPTTDDSLFELAHDFQGVAEITRGFGLSQPK